MKDNNFNFNQIFLNTLDSRASEQLLAFLHLNNISANISEKSLSILLAKASFAFLLISMFSYWFQMSFKSEILMKFASYQPVLQTKFVQQGKPNIHIASPHANSLEYVQSKEGVNGYSRGKEQFESEALSVNEINKERKVIKNFLEKVPLVSMWSANITLAFLLSIRWIESGHFPLSNLYESLLFLSWSLTVIHLYLENLFYKREQILCRQATSPRLIAPPATDSMTSEACTARQDPSNVSLVQGFYSYGVRSSASTLTLGAITSPVALFTNAFATFSLPQEMQKVTVLVPALKSNWLIMHVSVMIISYAALLSGSLLAMAFLGIKYMDDNKISFIRSPFMVLSQVINPVRKLTGLLDRGFVFLRDILAERWRVHSFHPARAFTPRFANIQGIKESGAEETEEVLVNPSVSSWQNKEGLLPLPASNSVGVKALRFAKGHTFANNELATLEKFSPPEQQSVGAGTLSKTIRSFQKSHDSKNESDSKLITPNILSPGTETPAIDIKNQLNSFQSTYITRASDWKNNLRLTSNERFTKKNQVLMGSLYPDEVLDLPQILDNLSYRSIGLGFALLTIGILSGAVWANEAWGSYWSWDPKETWAFITWLVFALYLHTRLSKGWVGKESAFVASFGFVVIWFCYLGVNLFGKGLHSYGWFQQ